MDITKTYSRRSFIMVLFFLALLCLLVNAAFYLGMDAVTGKVATLSQLAQSDAGLGEIRGLLGEISKSQEALKFYFAPISAGVFILFAILTWLFLRSSFKKLLRKAAPARRTKRTAAPVQAPFDKKEKEQNDRRLFLHLFSVLQREGRFMDFLSEDLGLYEDAQIGAAVRSIHENCKKAVDKYLAPKAVIDRGEGDEVTVDAGFDPSSIKLTGNVTGEPPFKGILRHRGWQTKKFELPALSSSQDSSVIAPAEVEIV
jgi:hypothetical protein